MLAICATYVKQVYTPVNMREQSCMQCLQSSQFGVCHALCSMRTAPLCGTAVDYRPVQPQSVLICPTLPVEETRKPEDTRVMH